LQNNLFEREKGQTLLNLKQSWVSFVDHFGLRENKGHPHLFLMQVRTFETHCGSLSQYGMKHMRSFANICNVGIKKEQMAEASAQACVTVPGNPWSSLNKGFSA